MGSNVVGEGVGVGDSTFRGGGRGKGGVREIDMYLCISIDIDLLSIVLLPPSYLCL